MKRYEKLYTETWGTNYDIQPMRHMRYHFAKKELVNILDKEKIEYALDVGCGVGDIVDFLSNYVKESMGVDLSTNAIEIAKQTRSGRFYVSSIEQFDYCKEFDLITMIDVIAHIKNDDSVLKKIRQLLKENGILLLSVPNRKEYWTWLDEMGGHFRRYHKKEIIKKLEDNGFKVQKIMSYGFPFAVIYLILKSRLIRPKDEGKVIREVRAGRIIKNIVSIFKFLFIINMDIGLGNHLLIVAKNK